MRLVDEFIFFRLVPCKQMKRNVWGSIQTHTSLSSSRSHVITPKTKKYSDRPIDRELIPVAVKHRSELPVNHTNTLKFIVRNNICYIWSTFITCAVRFPNYHTERKKNHWAPQSWYTTLFTGSLCDSLRSNSYIKMSPTDNPPSPGKVGPAHRANLTLTLFEHWYGFFHIPQEPDIKVLVKSN